MERLERALAKADRDLKSPDKDVRWRGMCRLAEVRWDHISRLFIALLSDPSPWIRLQAAEQLQYSDRAGAAKALRERLRVEDHSGVRFWLVASLRMNPAPIPFGLFVKALGDEDRDTVAQACAALGESRNPRAIPHIKKLLKHEDWGIRLDACISLIILGWKDERLLSSLESLMQDPKAGMHDRNLESFEADWVGGKMASEHDFWFHQPMKAICEQAARVVRDGT